MNYVLRFLRNTNGVFAPKSPKDDPEFADFYASIINVTSTNSHDIRRSLRNDMAAFGSDFKKVTMMAKEMYNVE